MGFEADYYIFFLMYFEMEQVNWLISLSLQETARTEDRVCCSKHWLRWTHEHKRTHTNTHIHTHTSAHSGSGWWRLLSSCLVQTNRLASLPSLVSVCVCEGEQWVRGTDQSNSFPFSCVQHAASPSDIQRRPYPMSASSRQHIGD